MTTRMAARMSKPRALRSLQALHAALGILRLLIRIQLDSGTACHRNSIRTNSFARMSDTVGHASTSCVRSYRTGMHVHVV